MRDADAGAGRVLPDDVDCLAVREQQVVGGGQRRGEVASVLTNDSTRTLAVGLQGYATQNQVYWNQVMAASLTVSVPIVVGFLLLQRFLVAGMTAGSVK
jgi:hypothetical protein